MSEIYGFFIPNHHVNQVADAISQGLKNISGTVTCNVKDRSRNDTSVLVQVSLVDDHKYEIHQLICNVARVMSYHSRMPWFIGMTQQRDKQVKWDHTIPKNIRFSWQKRKYEKRLDNMHYAFSDLIENIAQIYDTEETNNRLDALLSYAR